MATWWEWVTPPVLMVLPEDSITVLLVEMSTLAGGGGKTSLEFEFSFSLLFFF